MALSGRHCCIIFIVFELASFFPLSYAASDLELLLKMKESLENYGSSLDSWNSTTPPCTDGHANWRGILCYEGKVWGVKLENMGLQGLIDIDSLKALPYLRTLSFMNNSLEGPWPEIHNLVGLKSIYLSNNKFSGEIPYRAFEGLKWLKKVYLSNNQFSGYVPTSLTVLPRLIELRLDGNEFTGAIPRFHPLNRLRLFNVANNQLQGQIPSTVNRMPASSFAVVVVCLAVLVIGIVVLMIHKKQNGACAAKLGNPPSSIGKGRLRDVGDESRRSAGSMSSTDTRKAEHLRLSFLRDDREMFDLQELLRASAEILGSGCFSSSYKAALVNGPTIVVKRFKQMNNVGKEEFQEHMRRLGRLSHPNLLPPVAYYYRREEKLVVTDYVRNGSLAVRLHGHQSLGEPSLEWPIRLKIVKGIAKGLEYLYRDMPSLIAPHGNLKSSNVLLSESFEPLLTDYGLVPMINQELAQDIMVIYKSPEYLQQGRITKKTDVWCLGILILEILTGKFPANFLQKGKGSEVSLASWVDSVVPEEWTNAVFDQEMGTTKNSEGEMEKLLKIALNCCEADVDKRWDLKEAVEKILEVKERDGDQEIFLTSYASDAELISST
ncbi:Pollen receptor-like kinase [Vigna angularis]|uniref:non-specific serine/threonine protein kinase n=1 Tax=Phaseolus angularis TaxID=3914 RepID=A0A8T0LF83_PHAAN|nr:Pollen receptor-like kinase [Vigna angularis]